jgi:hypothetical protein
VRGVWCMVRGVWCVVCGVWCAVRGAWCVVFGVQCGCVRFGCMVHDVCGVQDAMYRVLCVVCCAWCVMCGSCSLFGCLTMPITNAIQSIILIPKFCV